MSVLTLCLTFRCETGYPTSDWQPNAEPIESESPQSKPRRRKHVVAAKPHLPNQEYEAQCDERDHDHNLSTSARVGTAWGQLVVEDRFEL